MDLHRGCLHSAPALLREQCQPRASCLSTWAGLLCGPHGAEVGQPGARGGEKTLVVLETTHGHRMPFQKVWVGVLCSPGGGGGHASEERPPRTSSTLEPPILGQICHLLTIGRVTQVASVAPSHTWEARPHPCTGSTCQREAPFPYPALSKLRWVPGQPERTPSSLVRPIHHLGAISTAALLTKPLKNHRAWI